MAELDFVKHDQGGVNARILAKETKADFRRVEAASLKHPRPHGDQVFGSFRDYWIAKAEQN